MREKPRWPAVSEIVELERLALLIIPRSKSLRSLMLPILTFNRTVTEGLDACLPALFSKPWPRDSLSVGVNRFLERGGVPNKLTECMDSSLNNILITLVSLCVCVPTDVLSSFDHPVAG